MRKREMSPRPDFSLLSVYCLLLTVLTAIAAIPACAGKRTGMTMMEAYQQARGEAARSVLEETRASFEKTRPLGYEEPGMPIWMPPEVIPVWFYGYQVNDRTVVGGHWVYYAADTGGFNKEIFQLRPQPDHGGKEIPWPLHPEAKPAGK